MNTLNLEILSAKQMKKADMLAVEKSKIRSFELMDNAGKAVASIITKEFKCGKALILCGPGNNGGDGFVTAFYLRQKGWDVIVKLLISVDSIKGDALIALDRLGKENISSFDDISDAKDCNLVIDAIFGTGLSRNIQERLITCFEEVSKLNAPILAIDMPSGISADNGKILGKALKCKRTVTFFRKKIGHLLFPGSAYCGKIDVIDIGIPSEVISKFKFMVKENAPSLWLESYPRLKKDFHKYDRGHVIVVAGLKSSLGASRLSARAALRLGAGLVTLACNKDNIDPIISNTTSEMAAEYRNINDFRKIISEKRVSSVLIGPGCGNGEETRIKVEAVLEICKFAVLDADALTAFEMFPDRLLKQLNSNKILTPHLGEFKRLFPDIYEEGKDIKTMAEEAAKKSGAVILLKSSAGVIASPQGEIVINTNTTPYLATAGSGDVLAGMIASLVGDDKMRAFEGACAGSWIHGEAGKLFGPGLVSEDLEKMIPRVLSNILL